MDQLSAVLEANASDWKGSLRRNFEPHVTATQRVVRRPSREYSG